MHTLKKPEKLCKVIEKIVVQNYGWTSRRFLAWFTWMRLLPGRRYVKSVENSMSQ